MTLKNIVLAAGVAAASMIGAAANAASITIQDFGVRSAANLTAINAAFTAATAGGTIETFETGFTNGQTGPINTTVGTFSTLGAVVGSGSTCQALNGGTCANIAIQDQRVVGEVNNQGNVVPVGGFFSLNSADTGGMIWNASRPGNQSFTRLVFALRDAADQRTTWTVATDGSSDSVTNQANGNLKLVTIDFGMERTSATVFLTGSRNDAFTIDGAAISPVPVPAAGLLLMGGLGALAAMRARKKAAA